MFDDDVLTEGSVPEAAAPANDAEAQLAAANAKADENYNKFLMAMADFENYKKRMQRDIESIVTSRRRELLERLLPVLDNLERALQFDAGNDGLRNGLEQTLKGFEATLAAEGVKVIDVAGKPFDPRIAEAIGTVPPRDGVDDDTIVEVAKKGYTIGEELLRPAQVLVTKAPA
jgi:molecular chaperone GrpE